MTGSLFNVVSVLAENGLDGNLVYVVIFLIISVLGGILQKKKSGEKDSAGQRQPGPRDRRRRAPLPPRRVEPPVIVARPPVDVAPPQARPVEPPATVLPRPERPARAARTVSSRADVFEHEIAVSPGGYTPQELRRAQASRRRQARREPETDLEFAGDEELPPPLAVAATGPFVAGPVSDKATGRLRQMLHDTTDLRVAFVLSEILAPPLALRDER